MNYERYSIKGLGLLDQMEEDSFDHITELASNILSVPVSLVSIIDRPNNRQFFKSMHGMEVPWSLDGEIPLSHSFCQYVAADDAPLNIENAHENERVQYNLAISSFGVMAYLGVPLHDPQGLAIGALCAIDTKPRKWSEEDLSKLKALGLCIDDAIRLRSAFKTSETAREEQADLAYVMTHDIKAPIFTLKTLLGELGPMFSTGNADNHALFLDKALQTTDRMEQKTADILQYARAGQDRDDIGPIDLNSIAAEVLDDISGILQNTNAKITVDDLPWIDANKKHMQLLFQNLLSNALKFQPTGQTPEITISAVADLYEDVITISDNGIGVDEKHQDQIFKLFGRLHTQNEFPGTGMGLALSAKIVKYMNGEISIQSKMGEGTTISIVFPKQLDLACI